MIPKIKVEFCITGNGLRPEEITGSLNVIPTKTWLEGDPLQGTKLRRKHNGWCLSLKDEASSLDLDANISELLRFLLPKSDQVSYLCSEYDMDCELSCAIRIREEVPAINLNPKTLSALSSLNAAIDIDVILTE